MAKKRKTRKQKQRIEERRQKELQLKSAKTAGVQSSDQAKDSTDASAPVKAKQSKPEQDTDLVADDGNRNIRRIKYSITVFVALITLQFVLWLLLKFEMLPQTWIELLS